MKHKIVMLGEGGVGKSCLSIQLCHNYFTVRKNFKILLKKIKIGRI